MNSPAKSAPLAPGELTAEDAERFAALFKPIWELDDAPFAQADPDALASDTALAQAGIRNDVQPNGVAASVGAHAPPPARHEPAQDDGSVVLDIEPDPTPPPPQRPVVAQAQPQAAPMRAQMPTEPRRARPSRPPSSKRRPPAPVVRSHGRADLSGDFVPPKKSNTGLFVGIGVVALLAAGGIAYKLMGPKDEGKPAQPSVTTAQTHEEPRIPPPPVIDDTQKAASTNTPEIETPKIDTPKVETPKIETPPPTTTKTTAVVKPVDTPKPPPPTTTKTTTSGTGTKPASTKSGGGGIVRDNPF